MPVALSVWVLFDGAHLQYTARLKQMLQEQA